MSSKIIYPIFDTISEFTFETQLIKILEDCSRGVFPKGVEYDKDMHIITIDDTEYKLRKTPERMYKKIRKIFSNHDIFDSKSNRSVIQDVENENNWTEMSKRSKERAIINYIIKLCGENDHSRSNYNKLTLGIRFKNLLSDDIEVEDGEIKTIKNIEYNKNTHELLFKRNLKISKGRTNVVERKTRIEKKMTKWKKNLL